MCFGGTSGSKKSTAKTQPKANDISEPQAPIEPPKPQPKPQRTQFDWWIPPRNTDPILSLNPLATGQPQTLDDFRRTGRARLTIPLRGSGLGIPGR